MMRAIETLNKMVKIRQHYSTGWWPLTRPKRCRTSLTRNPRRLRGTQPIGIDFGHSAIKVVALDARRNPPCIAGYAIEPRDDPSTPPSAEAIRHAVDQASDSIGDVAIALPTTATLTRLISLPSTLHPNAIAARIQLAAQQALRQPLNTLYYDFRALNHDSTEATQYQLTACRRSEVEVPASRLKSARLRCRVVDTQAHALARSVQLTATQQDLEGTIGIVDSGQTQLHLSVLHNQTLIYSQDAGLPEKPGTTPLDSVLERALALYQSNPEHPEINHLWMSGGNAHALMTARSESLDPHPLTAIDPLSILGTQERVDPASIQHDLPRLLIALGLALHASDTHAHWR